MRAEAGTWTSRSSGAPDLTTGSPRHRCSRLRAAFWPDRDRGHRHFACVAQAVQSWRSWVHKAESTGSRSWAAPHEELIIRAELTIKMLSHGETGAIAAAPTTSLAEDIGGVRNWDYWYSWIRDAALAAARPRPRRRPSTARPPSVRRSSRIWRGTGGPRRSARAMLPSTSSSSTSSVSCSVPSMSLYGRRRAGEDILAFLPEVADDAGRQWQERDFGLWELRKGPFHFVYSKVMLWTPSSDLSRPVARGSALWLVAGCTPAAGRRSPPSPWR